MSLNESKIMLPTISEWESLPVEDKLQFFLAELQEGIISDSDLYSLTCIANLGDKVNLFSPIIGKLLDVELGKTNPSLLLLLLEYFKEVSTAKGAYYHTERILNATKKSAAHARVSFSQEGEDVIIRKILGNRSSGTFVDVGAYHPSQYSNTFALYLAGWRGVNIEPNTENLQLFLEQRSEDIILSHAIGDPESASLYYEFEESAYNTFSEERMSALKSRGISPVRSRSISEKIPLSAVFEKYCKDSTIDVLDIDVEGLEQEILDSADLVQWKPKLILIEQIERELDRILETPIYKYLTDCGYKLVVQTFSTCFYQLGE